MYKGGDPFGPETEAIVPTIVVICNAQGKAQCDSRRNADGIYQAKGRRKQISVADLKDLALLVLLLLRCSCAAPALGRR